ncbi:protein lin-54 homolog [Symsagittifera roscoffensis]|uniref:protein lin-54 homolog n=1 Tax=Symsagittifera roscoffensis TaxID=84072 RepID=UPI00307BAE21
MDPNDPRAASSATRIIKVPRMPKSMQQMIPPSVAAKTLNTTNINSQTHFGNTSPQVIRIVPNQLMSSHNVQQISGKSLQSLINQSNESLRSAQVTDSNIRETIFTESIAGSSNSSLSQSIFIQNLPQKTLTSHKNDSSIPSYNVPSLQSKVVHANLTSSPVVQPSTTKLQYTSASKQLWESMGGKKKTCNCTKSLCLKLYCECFANGEFCFSCNCSNCFNTLENDFERTEAIRAILSRNPNAFHPKVGKVTFSEEKSHYKGCNCKKTNCVKNYCECFEAKILCTNLCKCTDCFNCQERVGMRSVGDVTALRLLKEGTLRDLNYYRNEFIDKLPFTLMTEEIIESVVQCLLSQAEEAMMTERSIEDTERMILQEFEHCTTQIIEKSASFKSAVPELNSNS